MIVMNQYNEDNPIGKEEKDPSKQFLKEYPNGQ